jgi:tetratricopeptide (TPR) repeat protein
MSFFRRRFHPALIVALIVSALFCGGCHRKKSPEERKLRQELQQALAQHSYRDAELLARRILQFAPNDNGIWARLAQAQYGAGNLAAAKATFAAWRSAVRRPSPKLDEYIGDVALAENDPAVALQAWHRLLGREPRHFRALTKVARLEQQQRHWMEADTAWSAALNTKETAEALTQRALCRRHLHHWPEALTDLNRAKEIAPKDPEVIAAGKVFDRLSKFLAEIRDLDSKLSVSPNDTMLLMDRCLLFLRSEDFELALDDADAAGKLAPWAVRPKLFGGLALLRLGRIAEAESRGVRKSFRIETLTPEFLETIRRLDSEISVERTNAELYATRAWHLNEIGQPAFALHDASVSAQLDPKSPSASAEKAYALMKLGRADEAFEEIQHATTLDPNYATAWQYRGELEMERRDYLAAIESLSRALSLNQTVTVLEKRETCYRMVGWTRQAEEDRHMLEQLTSGQVR